MVKKCSKCQKNLPSQPKKGLQAYEVVHGKLSVQTFHFHGHGYLAIADHYSKISIIRRITGQWISTQVITFSEYGIPTRVVSNNEPLYLSNAYRALGQQ